jgi:two-component system chemotaxis sensor kinase CheA
MSKQTNIFVEVLMSKVPDAALNEFYAECEEILQRVSTSLARIEQGDLSKDVLDGLYRDMHTLKVTAQLFGFKNIGLVAHTIEAAMEPVRQGKMQLDQKLIDLIYLSLDFVSRILKNPELDLNNDPSLGEELIVLIPKMMEVATMKF